MAPFYSRYVPSSDGTSPRPVSEGVAVPSKKRKLEDQPTGPRQDIEKSKKTTRGKGSHDAHNVTPSNGDPSTSRQALLLSTSAGSLNVLQGKPHKPPRVESGEDQLFTLQEPPVKKQKGKPKPESVQHEASGLVSSGTVEEPKQNGFEFEEGTKSEPSKEKKKKRKEADDFTEAVTEEPEGDGTQQDQHASIRSKFEKSKKKEKKKDDALGLKADLKQKQHEASPPRELHGLEPLPQPPTVPMSDDRPTFSSLPPWLANPLRVDSGQSADFSSLGLDSAVLETVKKQGLESAFPVQTAVIPLLTVGPNQHRGDVCISAATGSGKTMAYVLPMIQHLRELATTKLRGLIVVPTRELVRQARETFDTYAVGTSIKIATALGSKSLNDEQDVLVEKYEIYDPEEFQKRQNAPVDWGEFNLGDTMSELDSKKEPLVDFVTRYRSRVDVLICTPGRLVDHTRSTKGFTLDDVQWLVIDEADRLLNESFQEWTEIVIPALQSRASHALQDHILRHMRLEIPERIVQKVILSATLTQDISKLNSLKLRNPKLVVVQNANIPADANVTKDSALEPDLDEGATFNLPSTLSEYAVPIGDGAEKPVYLLELLRTKVNVFDLENPEETKSGNVEEEDNSSASDSDSSASDIESTSSSSGSSDTASTPRTHKPTTRSPTQTTQSSKNTALIFTRSTESATRLTRLLSLLSTPIASLTTTLTKSSSSSSSTRRALHNFRQNKIRIIIATDRASRGLDLPDLGHVISYDVPTSMTTYVHRVGRTARAGKGGCAWTLLAHREARWFWGEIGRGVEREVGRIVRGRKVQRLRLDLGGWKDDGTRERYEKALKTLGEEVVGGRERE